MKIVKKGFTLIELLIVIVVIGVLSAMMMLASTEVEASADVMRVINDMEAVKMAVIMCVTDNPDKYPNPSFCNPPSIDDVKKYLANEDIINTDINVNGKWNMEYKSNKNGDKWFLYYCQAD